MKQPQQNLPDEKNRPDQEPPESKSQPLAEEQARPTAPVVPVAVRALAEAIHRQGGLAGPAYGGVSGPTGTRLHQQLFSRLREKYGAGRVQAEVLLGAYFHLDTLTLKVSGRCDALILAAGGRSLVNSNARSENNPLTSAKNNTFTGPAGDSPAGPAGDSPAGPAGDSDVAGLLPCLIEAKSFAGSPAHLPEQGEPLHWAQVMLYGHLYLQAHPAASLRLGLFYLSAETAAVIEWYRTCQASELHDFFTRTCQAFARLAANLITSRRLRDDSARRCPFPYPSLRLGQKRLMQEVIGAVRQKGVLFVQAPTGTGKTMSVLFPAIRALAHHLADHVFYLTAMTSTRIVAEKALDDLRASGLYLRSLTLQAKEKICLEPDLYCDTQLCPLAIHYYDNLPGALNQLLALSQVRAEDLVSAARQHAVCPFELSLDLALYCDVIIGDYNYAFDPRVQLERFFAPPDMHHLLLVDEAHNLPARSREMYSASIGENVLLQAAASLAGQMPLLESLLAQLLRYCQLLRQGLIEGHGFSVVEKELAASGMHADNFTAMREKPAALLSLLGRVVFFSRQFLDDNPDFPEKKQVLDLLLTAHFFSRVADEYFGPAYVTTAQVTSIEAASTQNSSARVNKRDTSSQASSSRVNSGGMNGSSLDRADQLIITLMCLDAASQLTAIYNNRHPVVFFSATLSPLSYYVGLLDSQATQHLPEQLLLPSPFPMENLLVISYTGLSIRYQDRTATLQPAIELILQVIRQRVGNYLVFVPSYAYLSQLRQLLRARTDLADLDCLLQIPGMTEAQKQRYLRRFETFGQRTLLALAVMGSLFNEGIDLGGERLTGVIIVGVGLPQLSPERELLRQYYAEQLGSGYEYAYLFPGFNKVQQAAGRVIRSETDRGFVLLVDDRYQRPEYHQLYPHEWHPLQLDQPSQVIAAIHEFWTATT